MSGSAEQPSEAWGLAPATLGAFSAVTHRYIVPGLGDVSLAALTTSHITGFCDHLMSKGTVHSQPLSPNAMLGIHRILLRVLDDAVTWGVIWPRNLRNPLPTGAGGGHQSGYREHQRFLAQGVLAAKAAEQMKTVARTVAK